MNKVKGIIFDMDGLMLDTEGMYGVTAEKAAEMVGLPYDEAFERQFTGAGFELRARTYHEHYDAQLGADVVTAFLDKCEELVAAEFAAGNIDKKPGLENLLTFAQEHGVQSIVASSNDRDAVELLLKKHNLTDKFVDIVTAGDVEKAKPDPAIFNLAQERLGFAKDEVLVLEDSKNGIMAAKNANIPVIMIPDTIEPTEELTNIAVAVLPTLNEVIEYL